MFMSFLFLLVRVELIILWGVIVDKIYTVLLWSISPIQGRATYLCVAYCLVLQFKQSSLHR